MRFEARDLNSTVKLTKAERRKWNKHTKKRASGAQFRWGVKVVVLLNNNDFGGAIAGITFSVVFKQFASKQKRC